MNIATKVKGIDDFGKTIVRKGVYRYEHSCPIMKENDFLIYFYPNENSVGIYQVTGEISFYYKDGFQMCSGNMYRYPTTPEETINKIGVNNPVLAEKIHDIICSKIELYFTQTV
jgi:hypothetical protein